MSKGINYISTNSVLPDAIGKTGQASPVNFPTALFQGQAPDEGLYVPERLPSLQLKDIYALKGKPYWQAAELVAKAFLGDLAPSQDLRKIVQEAYDFPVPLEMVYDRKYILRLDCGPTASFKDFAARMMARLMAYFRRDQGALHILVATSGDTGSAVGEAFRGVAGTGVFILYPRLEVSEIQRRQLDSIGENVLAISVEGKFDDCQNLVKRAFSDPELTALNLSSANSINFGRILPQMVYYFWTYAQLAEEGEEIVFAVPSGNFGNALGCEYARRLGLPLRKLVMPTNGNDEFPRYLQTGKYEKIEPSRNCLSNAMNVGHPSNLARFFYLYGGLMDRHGIVHKDADRAEMQRRLFSVSISDEDTKTTIKQVFERHGVILEPHGAVGWRGLEEYLAKEGDFPLCVSLETAHPAKFPAAVEDLLHLSVELPPSMKNIHGKEGKAQPMENNYERFKIFLKESIGSGRK